MISWLNKINLFLRSLLFSVTMIVVTIPYSFLCLFAGITMPLHYRCRIIQWWTSGVIWLLKVCCQVNYTVEGLENIPKNRNGIIFSKHQSTWETFYLQSTFPDMAIILKRELCWVPFFGWGLATTSPIAINRGKTSTAMQQIFTQGKKCLDQGRWVLIFPEGTRIPYGKVGNYKQGGARLAIETGYPIIPIAHDAGRYWPKRSFIKKPGTIRVVIGPLIESEGYTAEELTEKAKSWIEETIHRLAHYSRRPAA